MFCYKCGERIDDEAIVCPKCGCATKNYGAQGTYSGEASTKSRLVALLLCIFLGVFGVHRFYVGKIGTGIIWLLSWGCFGFGWLIDIIWIACGKMTDGQGYPVLFWE